jgi:transposase
MSQTAYVPHDWKDERIEQLEGRIVHLERMVSERDATIAKLSEQLALALEQLSGAVARIATLEEQVRRSSRNSSQPPSSDGPSVLPRGKNPTGRRPGGQLGHKKHKRTLYPPEKVTRHIVVRPERCEGCHAPLKGDDLSPHRHQTVDVPPILPVVTEYEVHSLKCTECGVHTSGVLPPDAPTGVFGPGVEALIGVLTSYKLSKRAVVECMDEVFGVHMSLGAVIGCQAQVRDALAVPYDEAKAFLTEQPVKYADETGWREQRKRAFLWCAVTPHVTVFQIHPRRNAPAAQALLGRCQGIVVTDRHGAYNLWPALQRQLCWAHLIRDFRKIAERGGQCRRIGESLLAESKRMFAWWHRLREKTLLRTTFQVYMRSVQRRVMTVLAEGERTAHSKTAKTCKKLLDHYDSLWTFVRREGVEPTNNTAERAVRYSVLIRKISFGTHCQAGSRFIERILTVRASLRSQHRRVLDFLRDACLARLYTTTTPSLLPALA